MLDRSTGDELVAPPTWREEDTDWEAQEEIFEPSMLSDDLPAVGALLGEQRRGDRRGAPAVALRVRRHTGDPARARPGARPGPEPLYEPEPVRGPVPIALHEPPLEPEYESAEVVPRVASPETAAASAAAASRLVPPQPPEPKVRATRTSRSAGTARTGNVSTAGTSGRDMRVAIGVGVLFGVVGLACFAAGTVATLILVTVVVLSGHRRGVRRVPACPVPPRHAAGPGRRDLADGRDLQQGRGGPPARARPAGGRVLHLVPGPGGAGG